MFHLLPVDSAMGGTKHCGRLEKPIVAVLHLKVASTICGCEVCAVDDTFLYDLAELVILYALLNTPFSTTPKITTAQVSLPSYCNKIPLPTAPSNSFRLPTTNIHPSMSPIVPHSCRSCPGDWLSIF